MPSKHFQLGGASRYAAAMDFSAHPDSDASGSGQRFEIDLTRYDIRSGTLSLPSSMLQVFEAGPVALHDPARERDYTLTFTPPRILGGLEAFIDDHGLQPNDTLIFVIGRGSVGGELHARKRPPKKKPKLEEPPVVETDPPDPEPIVDTAPPQAEAGDSGWVVREVRRPNSAGPPPSRQELPPVFSSPREQEAEPEPPPQPEKPVPRRRDRTEARVEKRPDPAQQLRSPPASPEEALTLVKAHLGLPDTPAIVRLEDVAHALRLPEEAAWHALESLARDPESGVSLIRRDFYRVSRKAQPKTG